MIFRLLKKYITIRTQYLVYAFVFFFTLFCFFYFPRIYSALLFLAYFLIFMGINLFFNFTNQRRIRQHEILNQQLGLQQVGISATPNFPFSWMFLNKKENFKRHRYGFQRVYPHLYGVYLGRKMVLHTQLRKQVNRRVAYTVIQLEMTYSKNGFMIRSKNWRDKFKLNLFKKRTDLPTKDIFFNDRFLVYTRQTDFTLEVLDAYIRKMLKEPIFKGKSLQLELKDGILQYEEKTSIDTLKERKRFEEIILLMMMIGKKIDAQLKGNKSKK